jgi:hypothetical protein
LMTTIAWTKRSLRQLAYLWVVHTLPGLSPKAKKEEDGHQNVGHVGTNIQLARLRSLSQ